LRIAIYYLFVLICCTSTVSAQKRIYNFLHFTEKDGLASNEIAGLEEDSNGLIWITSKRGLSYFDGHKFRDIKFEENPEILTNYLGSIAIDQKNRIWITTNSRGLICYDRTKPKGKNLSVFSAKVSDEGLIKTNLYDVLASKSGLIYFSGQETDLQCLNPETGEIKQLPMPGIKSKNYLSIYTIKEDAQGNIWLGTRYDGLICYNPIKNTAKQLNLENTGENGVGGFVFQPEKFYAGYYDHDLISADYNFSDIKTAILNWDKNVDYYDNFISAMSFWPAENKILIGHVSKGIYTYQIDAKKIDFISWQDLMPELPKPSRVHTFCPVKDGYWIGTESGLFFYSAKLNKINNLIPTESNDPILELFDWKNKTWYRTENNFGEISSDLSFRKSNFSLDGIKLGQVNTTMEAIYFSSIDQGIFEFKEGYDLIKPLEIVGEENEFRSADCNTVILDTVNAEPILWIASWNRGLYKYSLLTKTLELFSVNEGLPDPKIITMGQDANKSIWLGMDGYGLVLLENKQNPTFKQFTQQWKDIKSIQSNTVLTFFLDSKKRFWYSNSNSGIAEIKGDDNQYDFMQYPDNSSHPWLFPVRLAEDRNNMFWIKALDGTMVFDPDSKIFLHLNKAAGIYPPEEFKTYNFYIADNILVWCTNEGLVVGALPAFYADKAPNIKILVNSFLVYHQDRSNELLKEKIKLAPDDNNITFHYSSAEQIIEHDLKFEYKLEGFDKNWIKGSSEQIAVYNNLEGGKYTFMVKVRDQFGNWSPHVKKIELELASHWYATIWFKIFFILLFVSAISLFYFYRIKEHKKINKLQADYNLRLQDELTRNATKIKEQAAAIEKEKQERLENDYKQKLFESELKAVRSQMNPHFIFNVLNSIEAYVVEKDSKSASDLIQKFAKISRLVLENSQYSTVSLKSEIELLKLYLELEQERFNQAFEFELEIQQTLLDDNKSIPSMLIQPLVENAVHHGVRHLQGKKGLIKIKMNEVKEKIIIQIMDNGVGFSPQAKYKSNSFKQSSFGIKGVQERINIINSNSSNQVASLEIVKEAKGADFVTNVIITLPPTSKTEYPDA
jgi:sensor histidine kinase YesM/ligand-binding sensor domain-containing protein